MRFIDYIVKILNNKSVFRQKPITQSIKNHQQTAIKGISFLDR